VIDLDRGRPPEQADFDLDLPLVVIDFLYRAREVGKRTARHFHDLADPERDLLPRLDLLLDRRQPPDLVPLVVAPRLRLPAPPGRHVPDLADPERALLPRLDLLLDRRQPQDLVHLVVAQRLRLTARPDELDHTLDVVDHVLRPLVRDHPHQHVTRVEATRHGDTLAVLDLHDLLRRDDRLLDLLLFRRRTRLFRNPDVDQLLDLVLVSRVGLNRVPAWLGHGVT